MKIRLKAIAMVRPNADFIRAPSSERPGVEVDQATFNKQYAPTAKPMLVSFDADKVSNPQETLTYQDQGKNPLLGRYIIETEEDNDSKA